MARAGFTTAFTRRNSGNNCAGRPVACSRLGPRWELLNARGGSTLTNDPRKLRSIEPVSCVGSTGSTALADQAIPQHPIGGVRSQCQAIQIKQIRPQSNATISN
jgi:hypothetical protein